MVKQIVRTRSFEIDPSGHLSRPQDKSPGFGGAFKVLLVAENGNNFQIDQFLSAEEESNQKHPQVRL